MKADPNMAMAQYQLGMTALNPGQFADAVTALEAYLKVDPERPEGRRGEGIPAGAAGHGQEVDRRLLA